ncbi:MAG: oxidoreductase [Sphingobium sp.]
MIRTMISPVWFVTGCSTGLGRALSRAVVARGDRLVATARDARSVADLAASAPDRVLAVSLDVTDHRAVVDAVAAARARFGRIDVLVNNAGYGYLAAAEEGEAHEIAALFATNVFGLFDLTRAVLPMMRETGAGHVINISSIAGIVGTPGAGYYAASKFAVEGFTEALAKEIAPLGLHATVVAPGAFRTDWAGRSLRQARGRIDAYAGTAGRRRREIPASDGHRPGDPARAAQAIIALTQAPDPPVHLVLGRAAVVSARAKMAALSGEIDQWEDRSVAVDFPEADGG